MAEPQPPNVTEGMDPPDVLPANAEDRKTAQAMSSLDARGDDDTAQPKKELDMKALSDAMKNLGVGSEQKRSEVSKKSGDEAPKKPLLKVDPGDVALLVEQLDVNKMKATDLLRAHDADPVKAMTAWVTSTV